MKVAVLSGFESVPWLPIVLGVIEGLECHGHRVIETRVSEFPWLPLERLHHVRPDLALLPTHRGEWQRLAPYLEVLDQLEVPKVGLLYDDPRDMQTGIEVARRCDLVFTPEPLALDAYRTLNLKARHLPVFVCDSWGRLFVSTYQGTRLENTTTLAEPAWDVFWFGGTHWTPRKQILPPLRNWCRANGKKWGEAAGRTRWIAGRDLTKQLSHARMTLDVPRFDLPTKSNPMQVPCTYTGPRQHLAAACGTFTVVIGNGGSSYPMFPVVDFPGIDRAGVPPSLLEYWLDPANAAERLTIAHAAWAHRQGHHRPRTRVGQLLAMLVDAGVIKERDARGYAE